MPEPAVISSLIVQARPERLAAIAAAIAAEPGAEIHAQDPAGKLIVVLESGSDGALARSTDRFAALPGVLSVSLVFHHSDAGSTRTTSNVAGANRDESQERDTSCQTATSPAATR